MMFLHAEKKAEVVPIINQHTRNAVFKGKLPYCKGIEV